MAQYEKGPGSTVINMSLKSVAPIKGFSFVLITGVTFTDCGWDGLPTQAEFSRLYKVSDSVERVVNKNGKAILAGTFTYQCQRVDYYYVNDTSNVRQLLNEMYSSSFGEYVPYINFRADTTWNVYLSFLYPNDEILDYMSNEKVVSGLQKAGDRLEKPRQVDHWIYFKNDIDLNCFTSYAKQNGFKIEESGKLDTTAPMGYKLRISRVDSVGLTTICKVTSELRKQAKRCNGDYDGWETFVIK